VKERENSVKKRKQVHAPPQEAVDAARLAMEAGKDHVEAAREIVEKTGTMDSMKVNAALEKAGYEGRVNPAIIKKFLVKQQDDEKKGEGEKGEEDERLKRIVGSKEVFEKDVNDCLESRHLYHDLGRTAFWKLCGGVEINPENFNPENPQETATYIVSQFNRTLDSLAKVKEDAKALDEKTAELIMVTAVAQAFKQKADAVEKLYGTLNALVCPGCRQRFMMVMGMEAMQKLYGVEIKGIHDLKLPSLQEVKPA